MNILFINFLLLAIIYHTASNSDFCDISHNNECQNDVSPLLQRYILYDVNSPEGFNLRRDVYLRMAVFLHDLKKSDDQRLKNWNLVLPPWPHLYHWQSKELQHQSKISWGNFFDIPSLQMFSPVIEMYQFLDEISNATVYIDEVYTLQHFKDMFESGNFEDKMLVEKCERDYHLNYFGYDNIKAKKTYCLSFQGRAGMLKKILKNSDSRIIMFNHAEVVLHDYYGDKLYWKARRSMRFNKELVKIATEYRKQFLNSTNESDQVFIPDDWQEEKPKRNAKGGPYLSVHLRRKDFLWGRPKDVPSIENAASQIKKLLNRFTLNTVFIATDAPSDEYSQLKSLLIAEFNVLRYKPSEEVKSLYKDGGVAIIDQIICSHARYFIGTYESTFSFRIQEEREILGFPEDTTFNRLCGDDDKKCPRSSVWKIVY